MRFDLHVRFHERVGFHERVIAPICSCSCFYSCVVARTTRLCSRLGKTVGRSKPEWDASTFPPTALRSGECCSVLLSDHHAVALMMGCQVKLKGAA